jgi:hypothetical protein
MKGAYETSGKIFEQVSKKFQPGLYEQLKAINPGELVVVQGQYDHIETLLDTLKVAYELIAPEAMATHNGGRVLFVNCKDYRAGVPVKALQGFVRDGGRLVTTDWALGLVAKTFPQRLHKTAQTVDDVVEVQCADDIGARFLGLNYAQCHPKWWLETSSHIYRADASVQPLIVSEEMRAKYGQPFVAVGFNEGEGEVFHFISHLELQRTHLRTKEDEAGLGVFLKKMQVEPTSEMEEATVAELEAAYSTLNTLAYLSLPNPILTAPMKSVIAGKAEGLKSQRLL